MRPDLLRSILRPRRSPSLDLPFVGAETLDPRVTFTRASSATRVNASGVIESVAANAPRFDYDPVTLAARGFLIEEQRTNLLVRSAEFDNAAWAKGNATVTPNVVAAPDGSMTADKLVENTASGTHNYSASVASVGGNPTVSFSFFAKASERTRCWFDVKSTPSFAPQISQPVVDLTNGSFARAPSGSSASVLSSNITPYPNGWYRVSVAVTLSSPTDTSVFVQIGAVSAGTTTSYTGDGTSGIYIWGAQLEVGAFPTSYIPTTTAQVTRAADSAVISGANFSQVYNQSEGTLYADWMPGTPNSGGPTNYAVAISDGTFIHRFSLSRESTNGKFRTRIVTSGNFYGTAVDTVLNPGVGHKIAQAFNSSGVTTAANGTTLSVVQSVIAPTVNRMFIGAEEGGGALGTGHIRAIKYYPRRLSNAELQALTA